MFEKEKQSEAKRFLASKSKSCQEKENSCYKDCQQWSKMKNALWWDAGCWRPCQVKFQCQSDSLKIWDLSELMQLLKAVWVHSLLLQYHTRDCIIYKELKVVSYGSWCLVVKDEKTYRVRAILGTGRTTNQHERGRRASFCNKSNLTNFVNASLTGFRITWHTMPQGISFKMLWRIHLGKKKHCTLIWVPGLRQRQGTGE